MFLNIVRIFIIALLALTLNGEFQAHGLGVFLLPQLFFMYLCYVTIFDSLIAWFKLTDRQLFLLGASYGLVLEAFFARSLYVPFTIAGINPLIVIIMTIAWGLFAFVLPFWIGNKIITRREVGIFGTLVRIALSIGALVMLLGLLGEWLGNIGPYNGPGTAALIVLALLVLFVRSRFKGHPYPPVERPRLILGLLLFYILLGVLTRLAGGEAIQIGYAILIPLFGLLIYFKSWKKHRFAV